ncbi:MAG TPA: hypothetical protein VME24_01070 [Alphaproteobacteria bacterium]|nr:hypothetical protein [Alphaproteobacteria bacterium]
MPGAEAKRGLLVASQELKMGRNLIARQKMMRVGQEAWSRARWFRAFWGMKETFIDRKSGLFARSGTVAVAVVTCGYWASQIYATYFVSEAQMRCFSWNVAALCLGAFVTFFVIHLLRPWSKAAAILGLCSFAAFVGLIWYDTGPVIIGYSLPVWLVLLISTVFGVAGMALEANRCRHLLRTQSDFEK